MDGGAAGICDGGGGGGGKDDAVLPSPLFVIVDVAMSEI